MKTVLRNFLFLNTALMTDYLSTLEGYVIEGTVDQTESGKSEKGGKIGYKVVEGSVLSEMSQETKQQLAIPDAAKFQRLYELLEEQEAIQYLEAFDEEVWKQLRRNEVLEVQANIRLPKSFMLTQTAEDASALVRFMTSFGLDSLIDSETRIAIEGVREFVRLAEDKPIPLLFEAVFASGFRFVANLSKPHLRCNLSDLQGEAVVFGKILRILQKGQKLDVFSFLPELLWPKGKRGRSVSKEERRRRKVAENQLKEVIRGPAIVLDPLAVYR